MYVEIKFISQVSSSPLLCECDYQRTIGGKEVFKSPTSQVGAGHNAQPGEEEPIFLWHRRQWRSYRKCCLVLDHRLEILLVLGHKGEQPILPPTDLIGGIHPSNLGRTDEFDHIVPNNQHLTIQLPQIKTLLFPDSTKNKKNGIMSGYHVLSYSYMKMRDTRCIGWQSKWITSPGIPPPP